MNKFKLVPKDKKILVKICENPALQNFTLSEFIVIPEIRKWEIKLSSTENLNDELKQFLSEKYNVTAEINFKATENPVPVVKQEKKSEPPKTTGEKNIISKISGEVTKISSLTKPDTRVVIEGEIGEEQNGVNLREYKNGGCGVTFSVVDDTDGITCKKIFKNVSKESAVNFKGSLKDGSRVRVRGIFKYDDYTKENIIMIEKVETLESKPARMDNVEVKRTELHVHTTMSQMDAVISPETLIKTAASWGWSAVAITDHGVVQAFPEAAETAAKLSKNGTPIKVIYGMEGYLVEDVEQKFANHIILLAKNKIGLENLYRLVSISQLKYMKYTPRIPKDILKSFREGLIIGSACEAGELIRAIIEGKTETEIEEIANFYDYLEIQPHQNNNFLKRSEHFPNIQTDDDLIEINKKVAALSQKLNKPLVATCDAHFLNQL